MRTSVEQMSHRSGKHARKVAADNGWEIHNQLIRRDGAEVYLFSGGFELSMKKPNGESKVVLEVTHLDTASPHYSAALSYVLAHAEKIILESGEL